MFTNVARLLRACRRRRVPRGSAPRRFVRQRRMPARLGQRRRTPDTNFPRASSTGHVVRRLGHVRRADMTAASRREGWARTRAWSPCARPRTSGSRVRRGRASDAGARGGCPRRSYVFTLTNGSATPGRDVGELQRSPRDHASSRSFYEDHFGDRQMAFRFSSRAAARTNCRPGSISGSSSTR